MDERTKARPFTKWVGGKTQLLPTLHALMPASYTQYVEPFVGAGAMFFSLGIQNAFLSDRNAELINCYRVIQQTPQTLITLLSGHAADYSENVYYEMRAKDPALLSSVERAARFIFLLKTCFNGLYRVNKSGQFNTPWGKYKNPTVCDGANILACSQALANVAIEDVDFEDVLGSVDAGAFVYCDPPYVPVSETANFTSYTTDDFSWKDQERLAAAALAAAERGAYVMLSNADVPEVRDLYLGWDVTSVDARRSVNSKGNKRGAVKEVVIRSWIT